MTRLRRRGLLSGAATLLFAALAATLWGGASGFAAGLAPSTGSLGAGWAATGRCTTAALTVVPNLSSGNLASVTISGLPSGCSGATVQATASNGTTTGSGSGTVPTGGGSLMISLSPPPAAAAAVQMDLVLVGP